MTRWIKNFDLFSPRVSVFFESKKRYSSLSGIMLGFLYIFIMISIGIYFFVTFLKKEEFNIMFSEVQNKKRGEISGDLSQKIFFYSLQTLDGDEVDPRIIEVSARYYKEDEEGIQKENLSLDKCSDEVEEKFEENFEDYFENDDIEPSCLYRKNKEENLTLYSSKHSTNISYLSFYVKKCQNKTENNNHCFTDEEIEKELENNLYLLKFYIESFAVDSFQKYPFLPILEREDFLIDHNFVTNHTYQMRKVNYIADEGLIKKTVNYYDDIRLDKKIKDIQFFSKENSDTLLIFNLKIDYSFTENYYRSYKKIPSIFGDLFGVGTIIYIIMKIISDILSTGTLLNVFRNQVKIQEQNNSSFIKMNLDRSGAKITNNFVKQKLNFGTQINQSPITQKAEINLKCYERFCFKCLKERNSKKLKEIEKTIYNILDIKNLFLFLRDFDDWRTERMYSYCKYERSTSGLLNNLKSKNTKMSQTITYENTLDKSQFFKKNSEFTTIGSKI